MEAPKLRRYCSACGGDGWTEGMREYRQERNPADHSSDCVYCDGRGYSLEVTSPFGQERAKEIWEQRGLQNRVDHVMTTEERNYVRYVWDRYHPRGEASWMSAFHAIFQGQHEEEYRRYTRRG